MGVHSGQAFSRGQMWERQLFYQCRLMPVEGEQPGAGDILRR
jgi:hypothetical protein